MDNLSFLATLDIQSFEAQINKARDLAKKLNTDVSTSLQMIDRVTKPRTTTSVKDDNLLRAQLVNNEKIKAAAEGVLKAKMQTIEATQKALLAEEKAKAAAEARLRAEERAAVLNGNTSARTSLISQQAATSAAKEAEAKQRTLLLEQKTENAKLRQKQLVQQLNGEYGRSVNLVHAMNNGFSVQNRLVTNLKTLFTTYVSLFAAKNFIVDLSRIRGEFELTQKTLQTLMGDVGAANVVFSQLKGLAVESPYSFKELSIGAKQLSAYNIASEELFDNLKRIADLSAGTGVEMNRLILAYGQVRSAEFLRGQEVRQFSEAGINIVGELAKKFSQLEGRAISAGEVFDRISKRMVTFNDVKDVIEGLTNEGGKFFDMQRKQADTLYGKMSNLRDAYEAMMNDIGRSNEGILKNGVDALRWLMQNWEGVAKAVKLAAVAYATFRTGTMVSTISVISSKLSNLINIMQRVVQSTRALALATRLLGGTANVVLGAITLIGGAIWVLRSKAKSTTEIIDDLNDAFSGMDAPIKEMNTLIDKYEDLSNKTNRSKEETAELVAVSQKLGETYHDAVEGIDAETKALILNTKKLKENRDEVLEAYKVKSKESYDVAVSKRDKLQKRLNEAIKERELAERDANLYTEEEYKELPMVSRATIDAAKRTIKQRRFEIADLTIQINQLDTAIGEYEQRLSHLNKISGDADPLAPWQKAYNTMLKTLGISDQVVNMFDIDKADYAKTSDEIRESVKEAYEGATSSLKSAELDFNKLFKAADEEGKASLKERVANAKKYKEEVAKIASAFGVELEKKDLGKETEKKLKEAIQAAIEDFDSYFSKLDFYKDLLSKGIEGTNAVSMAFGNMGSPEEAKDKVIAYINKVLTAVNREGVGSIDLSLNSLPIEQQLADIWEQLPKQAQDALNKVESLRRAGINATTALNERILGFSTVESDVPINDWTHKVSQIVINYQQQLAKLESTQKSLLTDLAAQSSTYTDEEYRKKEELIRKTYELGKEYLKKSSQEKLDSIASSAFSNALAGVGLSPEVLQNWNDKTVGQIDDILAKLSSIEGISISDELVKELDKLGLTAQNLINAFNALKNIKVGQVTTEKIKALASNLEKGVNIFLNTLDAIAHSFSEIGGNAGESLSGILSTISSLMKGVDIKLFAQWDKTQTDENGNEIPLLSGLDKIGGIASIATAAISTITNIIMANKQANEEAARAAFEYAEALQEIARSSRLEKYDTLFGTEDLGVLRENIAIMKEAKGEIDSLLSKYRLTQSELKMMYDSYLQSVKLWNENNISTYDQMKPVSFETYKSRLSLSADKFGREYTDIIAGKRKRAVSLWASDIYDEFGNIDVKKLTAWYEQYSDKLSEDNKKVVQGLINDLTAYEDATRALSEYIAGIFDNMASDIADSMIESFIQTGKAVADLEDIFGDLGRSIVKSLLQSLIIDKVLKKYEDELFGIYKDYGEGNITEEEMLQRIAALSDKITTEVDTVSGIATNLIDASEKAGLSISSAKDKEAESLGGTIKGITESTAELLGSYLNAIRQSVALEGTYILGIMQVSSEIHNLLGTYYPTCVDYLMKIAGHNAEIEKINSKILQRIEGVLSIDERSIRVQMQ